MIYLYEKSQVKKYLDFFSFKPGMHNTRPAACQMWSAKALYPARKAQNHVYLACFFQKKHPLICKNVWALFSSFLFEPRIFDLKFPSRKRVMIHFEKINFSLNL